MSALWPVLAHPAAVAQAAIEQLEDLDGVARGRHVRIGVDDERRHLQRLHHVGVVVVLLHHLADLVEQLSEVLGARRDLHVELVHRRVLHELGRRGVHHDLLRAKGRVDVVRGEVQRSRDELADLVGVLRRGLHRDAAAKRVADDVGLIELKMVDERRDIVGHELDVDWPIDVGRPSVPLEVRRDDLVVRRQDGDDRSEHLARREPAVQQDQRSAGAVRLVVHVEAVDVGVLAGAHGLAGPVDGGHGGLLWVSARFHDTHDREGSPNSSVQSARNDPDPTLQAAGRVTSGEACSARRRRLTT